MQVEHIIKKLKESYPYVDIIFGTHTLHKFPEDLYKALEENRKIREKYKKMLALTAFLSIFSVLCIIRIILN